MTQPPEYYIWVRDPSGESWHGLKPVTRERGEKLVAKYGKKHPENCYWIGAAKPVEQPVAEPKKEENP